MNVSTGGVARVRLGHSATPHLLSTTRPLRRHQTPQNSRRISSRTSTTDSQRIRMQRRQCGPQYYQKHLSSTQPFTTCAGISFSNKACPPMGLSSTTSTPQCRTTPTSSFNVHGPRASARGRRGRVQRSDNAVRSGASENPKTLRNVG